MLNVLRRLLALLTFRRRRPALPHVEVEQLQRRPPDPPAAWWRYATPAEIEEDRRERARRPLPSGPRVRGSLRVPRTWLSRHELDRLARWRVMTD